ncbi:C4-dicarboxylate ABC transporter [Lentibacillus kapialis]|uniref:C4-dicarboxylate ABC transporter n=1 Tax=Lentibacillus kapialis TaxID=340214 RepID=A0A917UYJ0_9BACI|nr:TRAP transporter substrate-binding protein DctP [Lentibacillus kapialis]GGJ99200.1 C4-dicarboxylate ABC transporter [Lentibacillus kapialis]
MLRKYWVGNIILILSIILLGACGDSSTSSEAENKDTIKLKVADSFPTTNLLSSEGIVYFMDQVEKHTDGKVEFEYYPAEQMGKAGDFLDLIQTGTIDIGYTSYATDKLPLSEVPTLPGAYSTSQEGTQIFWKLMEDMLIEEEYKPNDIQPLWAVPIPQYQIATKNKKVENLEDVQGLKMRATGTMEYALDELGASPTFMAAPEAYTALERGTVDGVVFPFTSFKPYQIQEIVNYSTGNVRLGSFNVIYSIDSKVYQNLPNDVKGSIDKASQETMDHLSKVLDEKSKKLREEFSKQMKITDLSEEELKKWDEGLEPVWDRWAKDLEKRGIPAQKAVEKYNQFKDEVNK